MIVTFIDQCLKLVSSIRRQSALLEIYALVMKPSTQLHIIMINAALCSHARQVAFKRVRLRNIAGPKLLVVC